MNVVNVAIPPLRDRLEDIPLLFRHLTVEARARYRREIPDIGDDYLAGLMTRDWPGNVRELRNVADRFVLGLEQMPEVQSGAGATLFEQVASYERTLIAAELKRNDGAIKPTYENLGLSRKALYEKMRKYELGKDEVLSA